MKELIQALINQGIITATDIQRMTTLELLLSIVERVNELHGLTKEGLVAVQRLLDEGFHGEVVAQLDEWLQDGTFDTLINQSALKKVNDRLDETNTRLSDIKIKRGHVVVIGDSISKGTPEFQRDMPTWLGFKLNKKVISSGIWGNHLNQVLERLESDVISYSPKYCVILCGTNDINSGRTDEAIRSDINAITDKLLENNVKPVWLTIPPRKDNVSLIRRIIAHNYWLESYCNLNDLLFVDIYSKLCNGEQSELNVKNILLNDDLHLTADGHRINAEAIYNVISNNKSDVMPKICNGDISIIIPNQKFYIYSNYPTVGVADSWNKVLGGSEDCKYTFEELNYDKDNERRKQVITMPKGDVARIGGLYLQIGAGLEMGKTWNLSFDLEFESEEQCIVSCYIQSNTNNPNSTPIGEPTKCLFGAEITNLTERISFNHSVPDGGILHDLVIQASGKSFTMKISNFNCHEVFE